MNETQIACLLDSLRSGTTLQKMAADCIVTLRDDNARLRNAMEEVCGDYESRGVAHNWLYYSVLSKALEGGQ